MRVVASLVLDGFQTQGHPLSIPGHVQAGAVQGCCGIQVPPRIQKRLGFVHEMEGGREQAGPRLVPHRRMVPVCHVYLVFELWASLA